MNFTQLLFARIGVGIGEAGGSPPAHSIISDYFPPEKRATALSIYSTGIYIGILLGYIVGGVIAKYYGWRMAFYALGIPGVLFAVLVYFTVKEPEKGIGDRLIEVKNPVWTEAEIKAQEMKKALSLFFIIILVLLGILAENRGYRVLAIITLVLSTLSLIHI